jgi:hypothetical protein
MKVSRSTIVKFRNAITTLKSSNGMKQWTKTELRDEPKMNIYRIDALTRLGILMQVNSTRPYIYQFNAHSTITDDTVLKALVLANEYALKNEAPQQDEAVNLLTPAPAVKEHLEKFSRIEASDDIKEKLLNVYRISLFGVRSIEKIDNLQSISYRVGFEGNGLNDIVRHELRRVLHPHVVDFVPYQEVPASLEASYVSYVHKGNLDTFIKKQARHLGDQSAFIVISMVEVVKADGTKDLRPKGADVINYLRKGIKMTLPDLTQIKPFA